ncbi:MAG: serine hydrolase [Candidatus Pacebacteria bacterium]|nr:serine hydrolase [Candidatus Paceibacterota bacterium]
MNKSSFPMLDPFREFTPAENYIINITNLRKYLATLGDKYPESITIYYENINSGANISVNKDLRLFPASLSKLVQAILIVNKVEKGQMSFDQKLKAAPEDLSSGSGDLYRVMSDGRSMTVEELLKELLVNSDNTAQNIFRHHLDFSDYEQFQNNTGLQELYNQNGFISSKEYTRILRVLYTSNFLEPKNSSKILAYMAQSSFHDYLSAGIPGDVKFAHKYGENKDYSIFADSGIVYIPGKPYMISVIIKGKDSSDESRAWAVGLMKEISEQAYLASK